MNKLAKYRDEPYNSFMNSDAKSIAIVVYVICSFVTCILNSNYEVMEYKYRIWYQY